MSVSRTTPLTSPFGPSLRFLYTYTLAMLFICYCATKFVYIFVFAMNFPFILYSRCFSLYMCFGGVCMCVWIFVEMNGCSWSLAFLWIPLCMWFLWVCERAWVYVCVLVYLPLRFFKCLFCCGLLLHFNSFTMIFFSLCYSVYFVKYMFILICVSML